MDETNSKLVDLLFYMIKKIKDDPSINNDFKMDHNDKIFQIYKSSGYSFFIDKNILLFPNITVSSDVYGNDGIDIKLSLIERFRLKKEITNIIKLKLTYKHIRRYSEILKKAEYDLKDVHKENFNDKADDLINGK